MFGLGAMVGLSFPSVSSALAPSFGRMTLIDNHSQPRGRLGVTRWAEEDRVRPKGAWNMPFPRMTTRWQHSSMHGHSGGKGQNSKRNQPEVGW